MIVTLQRSLKGVLPPAVKIRLRSVLERLQEYSLSSAVREQGMSELVERLAQIVPDLRHQYTSLDIDSSYLSLKVRGMHAFQIDLANFAITSLCSSSDQLSVVDIGDSAGTHTQYLQTLHKDKRLHCLSINLDAAAVKRIRNKSLQAEQLRAEDIGSRGLKADIFISFEMLEHLDNPVQFLKDLSSQTTCRAMVITVPYLEKSRVGLYHIRDGVRQPISSERTHIFELCPTDWRLLFMHAGWKIYEERLYLQYPKQSIFRLMKPLWKALDFEGFWGAVLLRDPTWSNLYVG